MNETARLRFACHARWIFIFRRILFSFNLGCIQFELEVACIRVDAIHSCLHGAVEHGAWGLWSEMLRIQIITLDAYSIYLFFISLVQLAVNVNTQHIIANATERRMHRYATYRVLDVHMSARALALAPICFQFNVLFKLKRIVFLFSPSLPGECIAGSISLRLSLSWCVVVVVAAAVVVVELLIWYVSLDCRQNNCHF